jgi:hypothetical protein
MTLEFKLNQLYRTRDGRKAQLFMLDNGDGDMLGCVQMHDGSWDTQSWPRSGSFAASLCFDLVSEWRELRKCRHEIWIKPCDIDTNQNNLWDLLGITKYDTAKSIDCNVRAIVTLEEIADTANS